MSAPSADFVLRRRRRLSAPSMGRPNSPGSRPFCHPLPYMLEALDLQTASPVQTLASLRFLVLSYLSELEQRLSAMQSPETWRMKGEFTIEDARQWAKTALDMLDSIRADVCSHLPELSPFSDLEISMQNFKSHLPDLPDVPSIDDMRSRLPDVPSIDDMRSHLPDMPKIPDVRSHLPDFDFRSKLDDVRARFFQEMDFDKPLSFVPTLSQHLHNLQQHLASMELSSGFDTSQTLGSMLSDVIDRLLHSEVFSDILNAAPNISEKEDLLEKKAKEVAQAMKRSLEGVRLITYHDLPQQWRNNRFVTHGYRFIPIERWPLIIMSLFALHNETLNIHTHLIPFVLWTVNSIPYVNPSALVDIVETIFMVFANVCLLSSAIWHTMSGCADPVSMEFCARVDYVGIGWLISASVATIVYYGFQCHPSLGYAFLMLCLLTGILGNVCPFMSWFNDPVYRNYRIMFFLSLAFSSLAPLATLAIMHSPREAASFISPVVPSLISYITGLVFYATHVPERFLPERISHKLDCIGGGSHCIWHCFIVLAVSQHKAAIRLMKEGVTCSL